MAGRILLIEEQSSQRILLTTALRRARYHVTAVDTGKVARRSVSDDPPDLIILGSVPEDTQALADALTDSGRAGETPLLILDAEASPARRLAALRGGARELLARPIGEFLLLAHVRRLLREGEIQRERSRRKRAALGFGLAEDGAVFARRQRIAYVDSGGEHPVSLADTAASVITLDGDAALDICEPAEAPSAYILNATGAGRLQALSLLPELRARTHSRHAAVLVIHAPGDDDAAIMALNTGAGDLLPADASTSELGIRLAGLLRRKADQDALRRSAETSFRLAATDPLTGLFNRRYADAYLSDIIKQSQRTGQAFAVLLMDIDHFKRVNDDHGHAAGDAVLVEVAKRLRDNLRGTDLIARFGGEEFLVVLPETVPARAGPAADRLRDLISSSSVLADGQLIDTTVSIGVALGKPGDGIPDAKALLARADAALYRAKAAGRNRIELTTEAA